MKDDAAYNCCAVDKLAAGIIPPPLESGGLRGPLCPPERAVVISALEIRADRDFQDLALNVRFARVCPPERAVVISVLVIGQRGFRLRLCASLRRYGA